jgi:hypothetical protein
VRLGIDKKSESLGYGKTWQLDKNQFKILQIETTLRIQKKLCRKNINDISILKIYKTIGFPSIHLIKYDKKKLALKISLKNINIDKIACMGL